MSGSTGFPIGTVLVTKVSGTNFREEPLDCSDIDALSITGTQTVSGQKTFLEDVLLSGAIATQEAATTKQYVDGAITTAGTAFVTITGSQTVSGQKTFLQPVLTSGVESIQGEDLNLGVSGTQNVNLYINGINKLSLLSNGELALKSHDDFSGSDLKVITSGIQTTADGLTTLATLTLEEGAAYWFEVFTVGRREGGTTLRIRMEINRACAYREVGGSATLVGVVDNTLSRSLNAGGYDIVLDVSGNDFRVRVDGAAGETVNWSSTIFYQKIATNT